MYPKLNLKSLEKLLKFDLKFFTTKKKQSRVESTDQFDTKQAWRDAKIIYFLSLPSSGTNTSTATNNITSINTTYLTTTSITNTMWVEKVHSLDFFIQTKQTGSGWITIGISYICVLVSTYNLYSVYQFYNLINTHDINHFTDHILGSGIHILYFLAKEFFFLVNVLCFFFSSHQCTIIYRMKGIQMSFKVSSIETLLKTYRTGLSTLHVNFTL